MKEDGNLFGLPKPVKVFGDLFNLYQNEDGTFRAEFGSGTAPQAHQLEWKIGQLESDFAFGMLLVSLRNDGASSWLDLPQIPEPKITAPFGGSNISEIWKAGTEVWGKAGFMKVVFEKFRTALENEVQILASPDSTDAQKKEARKTLKRRFDTALDALEKKGERKPHSSAATIRFGFDGGPQRDVLLARLVLQCAKNFVETTQRLPTKKELRQHVENQFPDSDKFVKSRWTTAFEDSGLGSLSQAEPWSD